MIGRIREGDWVEVRWWNGEAVRPRIGQVVKVVHEPDPSRRRWFRHYTVQFDAKYNHVFLRGHLRKVGRWRRRA